MVSDRKLGQLTTTYESSAGGAYIFNNQASEFIYVGSGGTHNIDASPMPEDRIFDVYLPEVMSYSDYYPFHMNMPGRNDISVGYRYGGANGQESQTEITGGNSHSTAEYWMYDNRLGRRWNVDPVPKHDLSNYSTFLNNPIYYSDGLGNDPPEDILQKYAVKLLKSAKFGDPKYSSYTGSSFVNANHTGEKSGNSVYFQVLGPDITPSSALDTYYQAVISGATVIDCGMFVTLVYAMTYKELMESKPTADQLKEIKNNKDLNKTKKEKQINNLKNKSFNELFKTTDDKGTSYSFYAFQGGLQLLDDSKTTDQKLYVNTTESQALAKNALQTAPVGTILTLTAIDANKVKPGFTNENVIKVGANLYAAFAGDGDKELYTYEDLFSKVSEKGSSNENDKTTYYVSSVATTKELPTKEDEP